MVDTQVIYNRLLARGYQDELFGDLGQKKREGKETVCPCPFCSDQHGPGRFSYSRERPVWKCWRCGKGGDWIAYLQERRGLDFMGATRLLAEKAGVEADVSPQAKARHEAAVQRADILERAQELFCKWMFEPDGREVLRFLTARGYTPADIMEMRLGAYVDRQKFLADTRLWHHPQDRIREAGLLTAGFGDTHPLTIIWRDRAGRATGMVARAIDPQVEPKYKYSAGFVKAEGMIGFAEARGSKAIIVVEGVLDAALLTARGLRAVALGGTELSKAQLQAIEEAGTRELILALDEDEAGRKATAKIIKNLSQTSRLRLYVVSLEGRFKDPAEMVLHEGINAFSEALKQAQPAMSWYAGLLSSQHDGTARGRDAALDEAFEFHAYLADPLDRGRFFEGICAATHLDGEDLHHRLSAYEARAAQRNMEATIKRVQARLQEAQAERDMNAAEDALADGLVAFQLTRGLHEPELYTQARLLADVSRMEPGLSTGYAALDEEMRIPRGAITILAGRPGHGKTAMMLNLMLRMAQQPANAGKSFFFFSYEEARARLAIKGLMILSGVMLHQQQNREAFIHHLKEKRQAEPNAKIEEALRRYGELTDSGRIWMMDQQLVAEDLALLISQLAERHDVGAVFVDYIQKISPRKPGSMIYADIKRSSALLLEQAVKRDVPIIMGAQLSRLAQKELARAKDGQGDGDEVELSLDMLREAGDIEQDANVVLGLVNMDKVKDRPTGELVVSSMKARDGSSGWKKALKFIGPTQEIKDGPSNTGGW